MFFLTLELLKTICMILNVYQMYLRIVFIFIFSSILSYSYSQSNEKYQQVADSLMVEEKFDDLIKYFNLELIKYPKNENVLRWLGYVSIASNNLELGEKYYLEAITVNPKCARCYLNIGKIYSLKENHKKALEFFNKAIGLDPNDAYLYSNRAILKEMLDDIFGALFDLNKAIELDPKNSEYYVQRGNYNSNHAYYALAISDYNKAIELTPNNFQPYFQRASLYYAQHELNKAMDDMNMAIKLDSSQSSLYVGRGAIYESLKEYEKAISDYNKAISLDNSDYLPYLNRASANYKLENIDLSCEDYIILSSFIDKGAILDSTIVFDINQNILDVCDSTKPSYFYQRGVAFYNMGKFKQAIDIYSKGLTKFPENSMLLSFKGNAQVATLDYQNAIENYLLSIKYKDNLLDEIKINPRFEKAENSIIQNLFNGSLASIYFSLSECKFNLLQFEDALTYINLALDFAKNVDECNKEAYFNLRGLIYLMKENFELAISDFDHSIKINNKFEPAYVNRAIAKVSIVDKVHVSSYSVKGSMKNQPLIVNLSFKRKTSATKFESNIISALNDCNSALEINNKFGYGFYIRGQIKKILGYSDYCMDLLNAQSIGLSVDEELLINCVKH